MENNKEEVECFRCNDSGCPNCECENPTWNIKEY